MKFLKIVFYNGFKLFLDQRLRSTRLTDSYHFYIIYVKTSKKRCQCIGKKIPVAAINIEYEKIVLNNLKWYISDKIDCKKSIEPSHKRS